MLPHEIKTVLTQQIPDFLIKEREQGKTTLSYISGSTVIGLLNHAFDFDWDWIIEKEWIEPSIDKFKADNNYSKAPDGLAVIYNGKRGMIEKQPPVAHVRGVLKVRYTDEKGQPHEITKAEHGSKVIIGGASEQDSIFKAASTDALKKAASMLGIGLQLYRDENELSYFKDIDYTDPWTDKLREEYATEWNFIETFKTRFDDGDAALSSYVYAFSDGLSNSMSYITPLNIKRFIDYCNSIV